MADPEKFNGIVAFFDVLGTRELSAAHETEDFISRYTAFFESIEGNYGDPVQLEDKTPKDLKFPVNISRWFGFNDTIIVLFSGNDKPDLEDDYYALKGAAIICADMVSRALVEYNLPL